MKKFIYVLVLASVSLTGCQFDDPDVEYPTKSMLFTYQEYNRELVVGEGLKFKLGVVFAGLEKSDRDRVANYEIDPSLVPSGCTILPEDYYSCSDPTSIVVKKGTLKGYMPVVIDSLKFVSDPKSLTGEYVIPFKLVKADADQITPGKDYMVLHLKYLAKQFGYYQYSGKISDGEGNAETYGNVSTETTSVRSLTTVAPATLRVNADPYGNVDPAKSKKYSLLINVPTSGGGAVTVLPDPGSAVAVEADGESTYDVATKTFVLKYKFTLDGKTYSVEDRMVFRNRIRDDQGNGVKINEWEGF